MGTSLGREPQHLGNLKLEYLTFLRYQITILVTIWLAVAAPITCQYHGLLTLNMPDPNHMGHVMPDQPPDSDHNDHTLRNHEPVSSNTLGVFIVVLPGALTFQLPEPKSEQVMFAPITPQEWVAPLPDKPPRFRV